MIIVSSDNEKSVAVGNAEIWYSIFSTIKIRISFMEKEIQLALDFLKTGMCNKVNAYETARQFNLIRDAFSQIAPEDAVYDKDDFDKQAPWVGNLSGIVTSCGNLYTTSDGKDLLYEIVCILTYAHYQAVDVLSLGWSGR